MKSNRRQASRRRTPARPKKFKLPDFAARRRRIFGDRALPGNIIAEERASYYPEQTRGSRLAAKARELASQHSSEERRQHLNAAKTLTRQASRRFASYADVPKTYRELCQLYLPRPIHDDTEDAAATGTMNALAVFDETKLNSDQRDYLDALTEFVDAYDKAKMKTVKWPRVTGLDVLKHLLAEHNMSAADLSRLLDGSRNLGAMILRGDRNLTLNHVRKLAKHFGVSAELFI